MASACATLIQSDTRAAERAPLELFMSHGIAYEVCKVPKSDIAMPDRGSAANHVYYNNRS